MAAMLLRAGLHGRRVPAPPWCAACRFDLSGLSAPARCPECGADLAQPNAVNEWRRVRHRVPLTMGLLGILLGLGALGLIGIQAATGFNWYHIVPTSILSSWVQSASGPGADRALGELQRRQSIKRTTVEDEARLRSALLSRIADANAAWSPAMQDELWNEYSSGAMSKVEQNAYFRAMDQSLQLVVRPRVKAGLHIPAAVSHGPFRVGPATTSQTGYLYVRYKPLPARILRDGTVVVPPEQTWADGGGGFGISGPSIGSIGLAMPSVSASGAYTAEVELTLEVSDAPVDSGNGTKWSITRSAPVSVIDGSTTRATPRDEEIERNLRNGTTIEGVIVEAVRYIYSRETNEPVGVRIRVPARFEATALPVSYRAIVRPTHDRTGLSLVDVDAGSFATGGPNSTWSEFRNDGAFRAWRELAVTREPADRASFDVAKALPLDDLRVDVVLVPDAEAAERTTNVVTYPNCELTFRDVPVYVRRESLGESRSSNVKGFKPSEVRWLDASTPTTSGSKPGP